MSGFSLAGIRANLREKIVGKPSDQSTVASKESEETDGRLSEGGSELGSEDQKERDQAIKSEKTIVAVLKGARNKYISRGVTGSIYICASLGIFSSSVTCEVTEEDIKTLVLDDISRNSMANQDNTLSNESLDSQLSYTEKLAIGSMDAIIKNLEWRSCSYESTSFKDNLTICRSITVAPPLPLQLFSMSIYCYAKVKDLIASRRRRHAEKLLLKESKEMNKQIVKELESKGYKKKDIEHAIQLMEDAHVSLHTESVIQQINTNKNSKNTK